MYAFASKSNDKAFVILKVGDYGRVIEALIRQNIKILNSQEVYQTEPGH
ncbi:hypothetical protein SDC9_212687 [bioreactor metagenome]|uniref:Uncharacterized protein n=1 Tax=bioreactor metagenome TaxID=1076179 RepID=A0A645JQA2_9ZZZZ